jgi:DNA-binding transcriptional LysR family regulator
MDVNQLEVLVAVANEKSFSRAADLLNRTQPAVSQAVRRLEEEIGERLFDRSSKDGTLTAGGEVLLEYAKQMLNLRESAYTAIRELRDLHQGKVAVSANEHTVFYLIPVIQEFRKRHPMIKVEVKRGVASRIPTEVMNREVELGVISFKPEDSSVISVPVMTDELVLIASPGHAFSKRQTVSITELGNESFIAHNAVSPYRDQVIKSFEKYKTPLNISVELPSLEAIKKLVGISSGLALVPKLTAETELRNGTLVGLSVKEMKLERNLHIIYRRNSELSNASKIFVELAKEISEI